MFHNFGYWMGGWGILVMLLFWVLVIALAVWLVRALSDRQAGPGSASAREILDQRYARGELSRKDYETMKADLNDG